MATVRGKKTILSHRSSKEQEFSGNPFELLRTFLEKYKSDLTETSRFRLKTNPLRILDTKVDFEKEIIVDAPVILDYLNSEDKEHFSYVKDFLKQLNIPYEIDNKLVRGLDYYSKTVFEIHHGSLGGQNAL